MHTGPTVGQARPATHRWAAPSPAAREAVYVAHGHGGDGPLVVCGVPGAVAYGFSSRHRVQVADGRPEGSDGLEAGDGARGVQSVEAEAHAG